MLIVLLRRQQYELGFGPELKTKAIYLLEFFLASTRVLPEKEEIDS